MTTQQHTPYDIEVKDPAPGRTLRSPLDARLPQPDSSFETEGLQKRSLSLVPPEVARVVLAVSGVLAGAAAFVPPHWNLAAAVLAMLLAATCGVVSPVPSFMAGRLPISGAVVVAAGSAAALVADLATTLQEGWPRALALVVAWGLSFVAGKPIQSR